MSQMNKATIELLIRKGYSYNIDHTYIFKVDENNVALFIYINDSHIEYENEDGASKLKEELKILLKTKENTNEQK